MIDKPCEFSICQCIAWCAECKYNRQAFQVLDTLVRRLVHGVSTIKYDGQATLCISHDMCCNIEMASRKLIKRFANVCMGSVSPSIPWLYFLSLSTFCNYAVLYVMFGYCYFELLASAYGHGCASTWSGARSYLLHQPDYTASQYINAMFRDVLGLNRTVRT